MEVRDIVQETGIRQSPRKRNVKKPKCLSEEALKITVKRKEVKSKGENERYIHLNVEFKEKQGEMRKPFSVINAKK